MPKVRLNNVTREAALAALFNRAKPQGLGMLQYDKAHVMTEEEARFVLMNGDYVDYLKGRVIKVDFKNPEEIDTTLYDRDNGKDAGEAAVFFARYRHLAQNGAIGFLPFKVMGHKAKEIDVVGTYGFKYDDVMGGTLIVYMRSDVDGLQRPIYLEFHHADLGSEFTRIVHSEKYIYNKEYDFEYRKEGVFGYLITEVLNKAMFRMLEKDKE